MTNKNLSKSGCVITLGLILIVVLKMIRTQKCKIFKTHVCFTAKNTDDNIAIYYITMASVAE